MAIILAIMMTAPMLSILNAQHIKEVWDGRELEWEPQEIGEAEDVAPFKKVGDDLINYFCHEHYLKLDKYDGVRDADKQCQACNVTSFSTRYVPIFLGN